MNEYQKQATDFLEKTNTTFTAEFVKHDKYFADDKEARDIYKITLARGNRKYSFTFGPSLNASKEFMLDAGNKPTFATKKEMLDYCLLKAYPIRYAGKKPNFSIPTAYDVLASLEKYEVGTFKDFCDNFGYDVDSIKALKTYEVVSEQYKQIAILYNEAELEEMTEIQ